MPGEAFNRTDSLLETLIAELLAKTEPADQQHVVVDSMPAGGGLTDTELRATPVPVSVSGVATDANQTTEIASLATIAANTALLTPAQGSTTSGETGPLIQGAVTTATPAYLDATTAPVSLTPAGRLRVELSVGERIASSLESLLLETRAVRLGMQTLIEYHDRQNRIDLLNEALGLD